MCLGTLSQFFHTLGGFREIRGISLWFRMNPCLTWLIIVSPLCKSGLVMVHWTGNRQSLFTNLCKTSTITTKYLHLTLNSLAYCLKSPVTFIIHIFKTLPLWFIIYNWKCDVCVHFIGLAYINWFLVKFVSWCDNHQFDNILLNEEKININMNLYEPQENIL